MDENSPLFQMTVAEVASVFGRGTVATGLIESGSVKIGDVLELRRRDKAVRTIVVAGLERSYVLLREAKAGEHVGILLRDVSKSEVRQGDVLGSNTA